jgi:hypothetical protein
MSGVWKWGKPNGLLRWQQDTCGNDKGGQPCEHSNPEFLHCSSTDPACARGGEKKSIDYYHYYQCSKSGPSRSGVRAIGADKRADSYPGASASMGIREKRRTHR